VPCRMEQLVFLILGNFFLSQVIGSSINSLDFPGKIVGIQRCAPFAAFAGDSITFNGKRSTVLTGSVGTSPGLYTVGNYELLSGAEESNTITALNCAIDFRQAFRFGANATCSVNNTLISSQLSGLRLLPGVYCTKEQISNFSDAAITLDGCNISGSKWLFQAPGQLLMSSLTSVDLVNGATANNVYWIVGTTASIGLNCNSVGTILANGSIWFGSGANIVGHAFATNSVVFEGDSSLAMPLSLSSFPPTAAPSYNKSYFPTVLPTFAPSFTPRSPTPSPTVVEVLVVEVRQIINGIAAEDAETDEFIDAFQSSIAQSISLPVKDVNITLIQPHLTNRGGVQIGNNSAVDIMYTVTVLNGNLSTICSVIRQSNFTTKLTALLQVNGFGSVIAADTTFNNISPTFSPIMAVVVTNYDNIPTIRIAIGSAIGILGLCFICSYFIYASGRCRSVKEISLTKDVYYADNVLSEYEINKLSSCA
jgi:Ice-binding-like